MNFKIFPKKTLSNFALLYFILISCLAFASSKKVLKSIPAENVSVTFYSAQVPGSEPDKIGPEGVVFAEIPIFFRASIQEDQKTVMFKYEDTEYCAGDPRFEYQFWWFLEDDQGKELASSHRPDKPPPFSEGRKKNIWKCQYRFDDVYSPAYPHKMRVVVRIRYQLKQGSKTFQGPKDDAYRRPIDQIIDWKSPNVPFPFSEKSKFMRFQFEALGMPKFNRATTCGIINSENGKLISRGLNPDIFHLEKFQESAGTEQEGYVIIKWDNLWDNFRYPFNGGVEPFFKSFGLVLFADWNLVESSPLVAMTKVKFGEKSVPPQNSLQDWPVALFENKDMVAGYIDLASAKDKYNRIVCKETKHQPLGPGYIKLKMPYDKVGRLSFGFFIEDFFQNKSILMFPEQRFIEISDDIAPAIMMALKNSNETYYWNGNSGGKDWKPAKSEECSLVLNQEPWNMTEDSSLGPEKNHFETDEDLPINLFVAAYDNCRLQHLTFQLVTSNSALKGSFGFRGQQKVNSSDGFMETISYPQDLRNFVADEAISDMLFETSLNAPIQMVFTEPSVKPSDYNLLVRAEDRAGNSLEYVIPIVVRDTGFSVQTIREIQNRGK